MKLKIFKWFVAAAAERVRAYACSLFVILFAAAAFFISSSSFVGAQSDKLPFDVAEFILSTCYRSLGNIDRVETIADIRKWTRVPEDRIKEIRPSKSTSFRAWTVKYDGIFF